MPLRAHSPALRWAELGLVWALLSAGVGFASWGPTTGADDGVMRLWIALSAAMLVVLGGLWVVRRGPPLELPETPPALASPRFFLLVLLGGTLSAAAIQSARPNADQAAARELDRFAITHDDAMEDAGTHPRALIRASDKGGSLAAFGSLPPRARGNARRSGRAALAKLPEVVADDARSVLDTATPQAWERRLERRDTQQATAPRRAIMRAISSTGGGRWLDALLVFAAIIALGHGFGVVVAAGAGTWGVLAVVGRLPEPGLALLRADVLALLALALWGVVRGGVARRAAGGVALGVVGVFEPTAWPLVLMTLIGLHLAGDARTPAVEPGRKRIAVWMGVGLGVGLGFAFALATGGYDLGSALAPPLEPPVGRLGFAVGAEFDGERTLFDLAGRAAAHAGAVEGSSSLGPARVIGALLAVVWVALAGWHARRREASLVEWADIGVVAALFGLLGGWTALPLLAVSLVAHLSHMHRATHVFGAGAIMVIAGVVGLVDGWETVAYGRSGLVSVAITAYAVLRLLSELDAVVRKGVASKHAVLLVACGLAIQSLWISNAWFSGGETKPARVLALSALRTPVRTGTPMSNKNVREIDRDGVTIRFPQRSHARRIDLGVGVRQGYRVVFWSDRERVGTMTFHHKSMTIDGIVRIRKEVPEELAEIGWTSIAVYPERGEPPYILAHFIAANDPTRPPGPKGKARGIKSTPASSRGKPSGKPKPKLNVLPGERGKAARLRELGSGSGGAGDTGAARDGKRPPEGRNPDEPDVEPQ